MSNQFDESDFVDHDYEHSKSVQAATSPSPVRTQSASGPSRDELNLKVTETQKKLAELKRIQEELEQERSALEESRRRQNEFYTGREEMLNHLTRGIELLSESEQTARRDAEQMARTLEDMREAYEKISVLDEESWPNDQKNTELTRALAVIDHARMEWNTAKQKWPVLTNAPTDNENSIKFEGDGSHPLSGFPLTGQNLRYLCKVGLAITWPLAFVGLLALIAFVFFALAK